jgi:DNA invertase Pin-like site-specific DNA recombinase
VALQVGALKAAGCERIFTETASGAQRDRPDFSRALDYMRHAMFWLYGNSTESRAA